MRIDELEIPGLMLIEPTKIGDARGFFSETFRADKFEAIAGPIRFVQDNQSLSARKGTLRGLHYQRAPRGQAKLIRVTRGAIFDVAVDIRRSSPSFGQWVGVELSAENKRMMWIPEGFAHGFLVLSDFAEFLYKTTDYWAPQYERTIIWNDPDLAIAWPLQNQPILSAKDAQGTLFKKAEIFE